MHQFALIPGGNDFFLGDLSDGTGSQLDVCSKKLLHTHFHIYVFMYCSGKHTLKTDSDELKAGFELVSSEVGTGQSTRLKTCRFDPVSLVCIWSTFRFVTARSSLYMSMYSTLFES